MTKHQAAVLFAVWNGQTRPTIPDTATRSQRGGIEIQWLRACGALHRLGMLEHGKVTESGHRAVRWMIQTAQG